MSNYSDDPRMVRVDFWKESGKWYTTEAVKWTGAWDGSRATHPKAQLIHEAFATSLLDHFGDSPRLRGMRATCLEPYHEYSHPISILMDDVFALKEKDDR